jgi:hypothetical protein
MSELRLRMSMSLDGFVAGSEQEAPLVENRGRSWSSRAPRPHPVHTMTAQSRDSTLPQARDLSSG